MKKIRSFKCESCELEFERMVTDQTKKVKCHCEGKATRQLSAPRYFSNTVGKSPSAR